MPDQIPWADKAQEARCSEYWADEQFVAFVRLYGLEAAVQKWNEKAEEA